MELLREDEALREGKFPDLLKMDEAANQTKFPDNLAIHLDTYSVADEDGAVMLFRQFDARKSARSKEDVCGAYQCFQPALEHCKRDVIRAAVEGVTWYRRDVTKEPVPSGDDVYMLCNEQRLHPFYLMVDELLRNGKSNELKKACILAAMFGTWMDDAKESAEFWRLTALGTNRNGADAPFDLAAELFRLKDEKETITQRDQYAKCAKAWLAYADGARVKNFIVDTRKKPLVVLGGFTD
jgi:hypothetical protein